MNNLSAIQSIAWETGLEAVKESVTFDSFDAFVGHLQDGIRQNSEETRRRYANLIVKRLFPDHRIDGLLPRVWQAYKDESILTDLARVTTLEAEPVIARFVVEQILALQPGSVIEVATIRDFISATYGTFKRDSYARLHSAVQHIGFVTRSGDKLITQAIPRPANAFLILLHARLAPSPHIVRIVDILTNPQPPKGNAHVPIAPFWRLLGMRQESEVREILRDAEAARLIAKYAIVDQLEQITTSFSFDEYLNKAYRL